MGPLHNCQQVKEDREEDRRTARRDAVVLRLVILLAVVSFRFEMLCAELSRTVLTFERQKVMEIARWVGALVANIQELSGAFGGGGRRVGHDSMKRL